MRKQHPQSDLAFSILQDRYFVSVLIKFGFETKEDLSDKTSRAFLELGDDFCELVMVIEIGETHSILGKVSLENQKRENGDGKLAGGENCVDVVMAHQRTAWVVGSGELRISSDTVDQNRGFVEDDELRARDDTSSDSVFKKPVEWGCNLADVHQRARKRRGQFTGRREVAALEDGRGRRE